MAVTGQTTTRSLGEFQCGQPCGWGGRFGERGSTATRPAAKNDSGAPEAEAGTHPGIRHHLAPLAQPVRLA
jgi:hypothetical protein